MALILQPSENQSMEVGLRAMRPYLPNFPPPKGLKSSTSRSSLAAPFYALNGFNTEGNSIVIEKVNLPLQSYRNRSQVGSTNRWRLSAFLGSDLLGTSQALKSVQTSCSATIRKVRTADNPLLEVADNDGQNKQQKNPPILKRQWWVKTGMSMQTCNTELMHKSKNSSLHGTNCRREMAGSQKSTSTFRNEKGRKNVRNSHFLQKCSSSKTHPNPTPMERFIRVFQSVSVTTPPDIALYAANAKWYLHSDYISKSELLRSMLEKELKDGNTSGPPKDYSTTGDDGSLDQVGVSLSIPRFSSSCLLKEDVVILKLSVEDPLISKQSFAAALLALYDEDMPIDPAFIMEVAATASFLQMTSLRARCCNIMGDTVDPQTVCAYHAFSTQYDLPELQKICDSWLQLNLVPFMSHELSLTEVPYDLLMNVLKSPRLFVYDEYAVYKLLCCWVFLHQQPWVKLMPSWDNIVTWFMSIPKTSSFLTSCEGQEYAPLFNLLRLNGITDSNQLEEMQKMNIVPVTRMLRVFSDHYYALQGGGDMSLLARFESGAVRYGYLLSEQTGSCSKVIALHGFYFELVSSLNQDGLIQIFFRRLKPNDSMLTFRVCERQTFSMRQDREVRYSITVQWMENKQYCRKSIGPISQCFGFGSKAAESRKLKFPRSNRMLFISYHLLLPPS